MPGGYDCVRLREIGARTEQVTRYISKGAASLFLKQGNHFPPTKSNKRQNLVQSNTRYVQGMLVPHAKPRKQQARMNSRNSTVPYTRHRK